MSQIKFDEILDTPIHGAVAIAEALGLRRKDGTPNDRRAFYLAERGYIDVDRMGRSLITTRRRLLGRHLRAGDDAA